MIGHPKYKRDDVVSFKFRNEIKTGTICIVDSYGTFEQNEEPSYDIINEEENMLYKHVRESGVIGYADSQN